MYKNKKNLTFGNIQTEKNKSYCRKSPVSLKNVNIEKVFAFSQISFGEKNYKYFIGYLYNDHKIRPLHIMLIK